MKIAFYVPNKGLKKIDFSTPYEGNPGSGAAEYLHVALPYYISDAKFETYILAQDISHMPENINCIQCNSIQEAAIKAKENDIDIFVFRPRIHEEDFILDLIDEIKLPSIGRAALTPSTKHQRKMARSNYFKALVAVGSEQYDFMSDSPIAKKLTYIDNGISLSVCTELKNIRKNKKLVTYMGAIVPQKGFHVLARVWPKILERHPDACLRVIGSSKIYNENYSVGPLGIADEIYERKYIIPYLCNNAGELHPSVTFLGALGKEKYKHLSESIVAVANPTGQTETCCVSAIEMSACSTAVVSGAYYALLGTVKHNFTGLLGRGDANLANNICKLLDNPMLAINLGKNGKALTEKVYDFNKVAIRWKELFDDVFGNSVIRRPIHQFNYIKYHRKWLRMLNYMPARFFSNIINWPSIQEVENLLINLIKK
jgi:glycosyltransferase involved in cell wall biosynthesis